MKIDFNDIKNLFDETWDVGYLSAETMLRCALTPIKFKFHNRYLADFTNDIMFMGINNGIVLIKQSVEWDYRLIYESEKILIDNGFDNIINTYTNFKECAVASGLGVKAKNSLVHSYKFGFDCHICVFIFNDEIVNFPQNIKIDYNIWKMCENCTDCYNACPAKAIHNQEIPYWLESGLCEVFMSFSDHDRVPSMKKFWHKNVHPEMPKYLVDQIVDHYSMKEILYHLNGVMEYDNNGYTNDGFITRKDGIPVFVPICRECTSQKRCSKWNGNYPYKD